MSGNGAFEEKMSTEIKVFMDAARVALAERPDPRLEADLVRRIASEARTASAGAQTREIPGRGRFALPARIAVAAGSLVLATAGLAVAGVNLPDPVNSVFEKAGVNLPNQSGAEESAAPATPAVPQPGRATDESGNAKAKAKSNGKAHASQHASKGKAKAQTAASNGRSESAPGHTKSQIDPPRATGKGIGHEPRAAKPLPAARGRGNQE
jgi:hypothetical protein